MLILIQYNKRESAMNVPESVKKKIAKKFKELDDESKRQEAARHAAAQERDEIQGLRESRRDELLVKSNDIICWLDDFFFSTLESRQMFALQNSVDIFVAHFWRGRPPSPRDIVTCAVVRLDRDGDLFYVEQHKGMTSRKIALGNLQNPGYIDLYGKLHPEFIDQWLEAIKNGKVWQYIERSLR